MADVLKDLWAEPAADPPKRSWHDAALIPALIGIGLLDGLLSTDVGWPAISIPLLMVLPLCLYWRTTHPLPVAAIVFVAYTGLHGAMLFAGVTGTMLNVGVICVAVYSLTRWASGRHAIVGLGLAIVGGGVGGSTGLFAEPGASVALPGFVSLFVFAGAAVRLWSSRSAARVDQAKLVERNRIARELHDTIAHHVSAIAVQAQGAQAILATDPPAARQALAVIEEQASLTLAEMRTILGVLRDQDPNNRAPHASIAQIAEFANAAESGPTVAVALSGDLENISSSVSSAAYRVTQEAITNARRHARGATMVNVTIVGAANELQLTVTDNGHAAVHAGSGHGLLGMAERAALLGGAFEAGPSPAGGWTVTASLPTTRPT